MAGASSYPDSPRSESFFELTRRPLFREQAAEKLCG